MVATKGKAHKEVSRYRRLDPQAKKALLNFLIIKQHHALIKNEVVHQKIQPYIGPYTSTEPHKSI